MKRMNIFYLSCVIAVGVAVMLTSTEVKAANLTCSVSAVAWATGNSGTLQVGCGGKWYYAFGTHSDTDCTKTPPVARRAWQSLAQSAFLSGKTVYIEYNARGAGTGQCAGGNAIYYLRLGQ